ncbi:HIT family protein [Candidatus Woesearchaeota archaeon]|nr:HIT family protein [Candidatus Woesearchaeota archaeon]
MENCVFCKIVNGQIPADKIYEDKDIIAFLDINPVNYGHSLVIPKQHFEMMYDVPNEVLNKVFVKAKELMVIIKKAMNADYVAVSVVGVDVPHFHVHLVPRYFNDGMANLWPTKKYKENEMEETVEKIRKFVK